MEDKILVVHGNELILDVVQEMLQNTGYAVTLASDGHRALSKAMSGTYSLIIVDRNLEGEPDGVRLVELLRRYGVRAPIIGTAPEAPWSEAATTSLSEVDYLLPAPFDYGELTQAVSELLGPEPGAALPTGEVPAPVEAQPDPPTPVSAPERRPARAPAAVPEPSPARRWDPRHVESREGPPRVLVVDNSPDDSGPLARSLEESGYEVAVIRSGQDAYEATMLNDYELIITDLWLTGMDGFEMVEAMRKSGVTAPIAVRTAYVTRTMVPDLKRWQVQRILLKSVALSEVMAYVSETAT